MSIETLAAIDWTAAGTIVTAIALAVAVIGSIGGLIYKLGSKNNQINGFDKTMEKFEKKMDDLDKSMNDKIDKLSTKLDETIMAIAQGKFAKANSPRQLTTEGNRVLKESGIAKIVDSRYESILDAVKEMRPENAYQAEQAVLDAVGELSDDSTLKNDLEMGAYNCGTEVTMVLFVGGIYIRDRILKELGMLPEDIDKGKKHSVL